MALDKYTPLAYKRRMAKAKITVVETAEFTSRAKRRMSAKEVEAVIDLVAVGPLSGDLIQGTGGLRKLRFAVEGKGKSGSVRIIYYYYNESIPVFLITVFAKKEKDNLTKAERNMLAKVVRILRDSYGE